MIVTKIFFIAALFVSTFGFVNAATWYDKIPDSGEYYPVEDTVILQPKDFEDVNSVPVGVPDFSGEQIPEEQQLAVPEQGLDATNVLPRTAWYWLLLALLGAIGVVSFILFKKKATK